MLDMKVHQSRNFEKLKSNIRELKMLATKNFDDAEAFTLLKTKDKLDNEQRCKTLDVYANLVCDTVVSDKLLRPLVYTKPWALAPLCDISHVIEVYKHKFTSLRFDFLKFINQVFF